MSMLNSWTPLWNKRETLNKIWLSVHWKKKVTKAHVIDCNLDKAIEDIIASPQMIGLRVSGSLLLGVAQIFSRKANYLLTDCSHALETLKLSFRPDAPNVNIDLFDEGLESTKEIPLGEDFTLFPHSSDINMPVENYSQHQSFPHEITMNEFSEMSQCHQVGQVDIGLELLGQPQDSFGDEGAGLDGCLDFLMNSSTHPDFTNFSPMEIPSEIPEDSSINNQHDVNGRDPTEEESLDQFNPEQPTFFLPPVPYTSRGRTKRKLIVDQMTTLSDKFMQKMLDDDSDLLVPLTMAPPWQLMYWEENGIAAKLLTGLCSDFAGGIVEAFPEHVFQVAYDDTLTTQQEEDCEVFRNSSPLNTDSLKDPHTEHELMDVLSSSGHQSDTEITPDEHVLDRSYPELPSEDSMFVHQSHKKQQSQSLLESQNLQGQKIVNKQAHRLLKFLQCSGNTSFSLRELCSGHNRLQSARTFLCLLFLQKERAVVLHQSDPYLDISFTAGPEFFTRDHKSKEV
ncbi:double-strand-break repair protein rad21-like protein 1 isoform X2 [Syngnathoides biaculeatus]|uniref:double-strand-break repair protein rad21-like protein 1 isoform X2 n=1 Tax=Syngnathoides biaculeatus TaxID=300417 RepID=UPI002ADE882B|nr:double-strand-break repair protein rad21-like protein 1 isoform X2 [Syngnathoides biaculeatus]